MVTKDVVGQRHEQEWLPEFVRKGCMDYVVNFAFSELRYLSGMVYTRGESP